MVFFRKQSGQDAAMRILLAIFLLFCFCAQAPAESTPLYKLDRAEQAERIASDLKMAVIYRAGLSNAVAFAAQQTNLFANADSGKPRLPRREEKELLWQAWKSYLDYLLALDSLESGHDGWWRLSGEQREQSFTIGYSAFLAKYRYSLDFVRLLEKNPFVDTILNEPVPELGLPAGTYARLKFRFLNAGTATDFGARAAMYKTMSNEATKPLQPFIENDAVEILNSGRGEGELLTAKNALNILKHVGTTAWFPVQAGVS